MGDGSIRIGMAFLKSGASFKLPLMFVKKFLANVLAAPLISIQRLAAAGMVPRNVMAIAGPEPEETEEHIVRGNRLDVSVLLRELVVDDDATKRARMEGHTKGSSHQDALLG